MQLGFIMESQERNTVFWIERRGGGDSSSRSTMEPSGRQNMYSCRPRRSTFRDILRNTSVRAP